MAQRNRDTSFDCPLESSEPLETGEPLDSRDKIPTMAHSVQKTSRFLSPPSVSPLPAPPQAVAVFVAETFDKENTMIPAEHSSPEYSAPHGASRAAISSPAPSITSLPTASPTADGGVLVPPSVSTTNVPGSRHLLVQLSLRRLSSSNCALLGILTLGAVLGVSSVAQAFPPVPSTLQIGVRSVSPSGKSARSSSPTPKTSPSAQNVALTPFAQLMPRAATFAAPLFPHAAQITTTPRTPSIQIVKDRVIKAQVTQRMVTQRAATQRVQNGLPTIRLAQVASLTSPVEEMPPVASLGEKPSAPQSLAPQSPAPLLPAAPAALTPNLGGMKKVIQVPTLSLPPLSKPLPSWLKSASVKVEHLDKPTRLAQSPTAPPIRNPGTPVTNSDRLSNQIEVPVSAFVVLLTTTDLQTVAVADPTIADVAVVNSRSVLLNGKTAGTTSLVIVDGQKIRQYTVRVTPAFGTRPDDVANAIGLPGIIVRPIRDALVLEGEVASAAEAQRAIEIAGIYSTRVVNQLTIRGQVSPEVGNAAQLRELINLPDVSVRVVGDTTVLSGTVATPQQIQDAEAIARTMSKNVINQLRLPALTADQVRESLGAVAAPLPPTSMAPGQLAVATPLTVREAGGQLVLEGTVGSQAEADIALATANRTGLALINRIQVRPAATTDQTLTSQVAAAIGRPGVIVRGTAKRLVLEGTVADTNEAVLAEQVARAFGAQVDNLLRTPSPVQCNVDVSIVELSSTDARNLGIEYGSVSLLSETRTPGTTTPVLDAAGNPVIDANGNPVNQTTAGTIQRTVGTTFNQGVTTAGNGFLGLSGGFGVLDPFRARLNALASQGKAHILSNPRTTVLSGRTATFQVGGQVPIPAASTVGSNGTTTAIVFKDYGILLDIVPNALPNGNTTLRVRTEVSQPDFGVAVTPPGGGSPIPGFSRRSTITEVTVPAGGTVALSGLISSDEANSETKVPLLSKIPILGALFRSKTFRNNQSELVIFVRPKVLPNPLGANTDAFTGVVALGENSNIAAQLGNPGLRGFDGGASITTSAPAGQ